ncbi:hypothetical protein V8Q34_26860 [Blautia sp. JLR.GB0024]|uniref:hypothetical protein n=1 Tax=Blautia sp. JLR.GB0024 TaxID=3123295 RepID=UPI003005B00A
MTDNEKRAHDLAIASIPIIYDLHKLNVITNPDMTVEDKAFDVYKQYMSCYNTIIESVKRDFPD